MRTKQTFRTDKKTGDALIRSTNALVAHHRDELKLKNTVKVGSQMKTRILKSRHQLFEILAKDGDEVVSVETDGDRVKFRTTSDNVYPGRYAKNSFLFLSGRSNSGMDDCRHVRKAKYLRWLKLERDLKTLAKYREKIRKKAGHDASINEIKIQRLVEERAGLTFSDIALCVRHLNEVGDHRDGSVPFSIMAHLLIHHKKVIEDAKQRRVELKIKIVRNRKTKKIKQVLASAAEKFGHETTLGEALDRLEGLNVIELERKKAA